MGDPKIDDPDLPLVVLFAHWPATAAVFQARGMACLGCPITPFHTVIDACAEYRQDEARFRAALATAVLDAAVPDAAVPDAAVLADPDKPTNPE